MSEKRNKKGQFNKGDNLTSEEKKRLSESLMGNECAKKLKTTELKLQAYKSYCDHLAKGKAKKSWYFEHPDLTILHKTIESYIENEPDIFPPIQIEVAWSKGYQYWESVVEQSAEGINEKANTASLQMLMRNKYKWDKEDSVNKQTSEPFVAELLKRLDKPKEEKNDEI